MLTCSAEASDAEILTVVEAWLSLLEEEQFEVACEQVNIAGVKPWTAELLRRIVKEYGHGLPAQRITIEGDPGNRQQHRDVNRFDPEDAVFGYVWYDLNIDRQPSDLTATFDIRRSGNSLILLLEDIHVMQRVRSARLPLSKEPASDSSHLHSLVGRSPLSF